MSNLREQVAAAKETALAPDDSPKATLIKLLRSPSSMKNFAQAVPSHVDAETFVQAVVSQIRRTPDLAYCDPASLLPAVYALAQVGLYPDGRNAHLVPFNKKGSPLKQVQAIIDYRGYMELAMRSGQILKVSAEVVYEKDFFQEVKGLNADLKHLPYEGDDDPGRLVAAYAIVYHKSGGANWVVLRRRDIMKRRESSKADKGPWVSHEEAMWRKTAVRALAPFMPYSAELVGAERIDRAADLGVQLSAEQKLEDIALEAEAHRAEQLEAAEVVDEQPVEAEIVDDSGAPF